MLIEIHMIQNHSPANLNRDDLGAPKTSYFGGVLRSRISSQCIKRSIRRSASFSELLGGIRTRRLVQLIEKEFSGGVEVKKRASKILKECGINPKDEDMSDMLVYTTREAIHEMALLLQNGEGLTDGQLADKIGKLISERTVVPDMALSGRMLETGVLTNTTVEAALQVAHAISTHEARPEVDYYVAADDIPGEDAGAGYVDEAMFASACFYKYFSINQDTLEKNLNGNKALAAHTIGAFIRGAALTNPTGKQNSYAAHNPPDGILVEIKNSPISYANAFVKPTTGTRERDLVKQSIAQLGQYVHDLDIGFGKPASRFWFSPNLRHGLAAINGEKEIPLCAEKENFKSFDDLVKAVIGAIGFSWDEVQKVVLSVNELQVTS